MHASVAVQLVAEWCTAFVSKHTIRRTRAHVSTLSVLDFNLHSDTKRTAGRRASTGARVR
jgi:hypothetical protein